MHNLCMGPCASMQPVFFRLSDARYHKLRLKVMQLEADLEQLSAQHRALRSTFYATRGSPKGPPEPTVGSPEQKASVLRDFLGGKRVHDPG